MYNNLLLTFILLSTANVVIQTVKTIVTIKCGKMSAALVNALAYGLYTFVIIYTNCDLNIWLKAAITAGANFVGVYIVKLIEERGRKERLWKIEMTVTADKAEEADRLLKDIPHANIQCGNYTTFNCYCATCKESEIVRAICKALDAKYFVIEQNGALV